LRLRTASAFVVVLFFSCQSSVSLDIDGGLRFPCTPTSATERTSGNCPGNLFCGGDNACHSPNDQGSYACRGDFDCGGSFRCGPKGVCVDPSADGLRVDAPEVSLDAGRFVGSDLPWSQVSVLGVGRTWYQQTGMGVPADASPLAVSDGTAVYSVAVSQQGLDETRPPQRFFVGKAPLADVTELAVARDQVFALAGGNVYQYQWSPRFDQGPPAVLDAGVPFGAAIGTRLRVGNSAYPFVMEFTPNDGGMYRVFDTSGQYPVFPYDATNQPPNISTITDMADTDGTYVYAIFDGQLYATLRAPQIITGGGGPAGWHWFTVAVNSPGRDQLIDCSGNRVTSDQFVFRSLHIGDNPDLNQVEHPLVAAQVDVITDGGVSQHWMRLDPDPTLDQCGSGIERHVARGNCPACGPGEQLVDLQWGIDPATSTPALRAECAGPGNTIFYDLQTDATGFACYRTRRPGAGYRGMGAPVRATSSVSAAGVAFGQNVLVRRDGLDDWTPLTLDAVPIVAQAYGGRLVALSEHTLFRETPPFGLVLHQQLDALVAYPAWISGNWLFYSDGRVGPVSNLELPEADARFFAIPSQQNLTPPVLGTKAKGSDGNTYLVMSANDALLGGEVTDDTGMSAPQSVDVKAVPEPQVQILSLAVLDPPASADAGVLFQGFVLTENRVFALDAISQQRWTVSALDVIDGEWRKVWADHDRGRLGYTDGRVFALPSGVQISEALAGGANDYVQLCGRTFALTDHSLYRLDARAGTGVGAWVEQPVLPQAPRWQTMYGSASGELWVMAQDGSAMQVMGVPCTP
jgi:hypothetical protein